MSAEHERTKPPLPVRPPRPHPQGVAAALHRLADRLDTQPNRPAAIYVIRGYGRAYGLTSDWLDLLPTPDGAPHSEYATRLREIAGGEQPR
ncbi:hypothetical protein [Streptomyces sp. SGAir0957]